MVVTDHTHSIAFVSTQPTEQLEVLAHQASHTIAGNAMGVDNSRELHMSLTSELRNMQVFASLKVTPCLTNQW